MSGLRLPPGLLHGVLLLGIAVLLAWNLASGYVALSPGELWQGLIGGGDAKAVLIVQEIRLPRALLGLTVGFSLGIAGAALQGLLRNPLAEPGLLGVSAMAGLGAVIVIYFGWAEVSAYLLPGAGMIGAFAAVGLLFLLAGHESSVLTVILAGVAINSLAIALTSLAMNLAPSPWAVREMLFWVMGSLKDRSLTDLSLALPFMVVGWGLLLSCARALDALTLGEDTARSLGVNLKGVHLRLIGGTALCVGAGVAVAGSIAFVGLVVPHLLRPLVGHQPSRLLVGSGLGGAVLTMMADMAVRSLNTSQEMNLGVFTAVIGAPFFLYLIVKTRRAMR
jgi:iron complex transport system permease protein